MKPVKLLLQIAAAAAVCLGLVAIQPASAEQTVTEEVLEILREKGDISDAQYEEMKARAAEEEAARAQQDPPPVSAEPEPCRGFGARPTLPPVPRSLEAAPRTREKSGSSTFVKAPRSGSAHAMDPV